MRAIDADALMDYLQIIPIDLGYREIDDVEKYVREMPTIEPERKTGKWICSDDLYETALCSCCGWDTTEPWQHIKSWFEFCPHCGADMKGGRRLLT